MSEGRMLLADTPQGSLPAQIQNLQQGRATCPLPLGLLLMTLSWVGSRELAPGTWHSATEGSVLKEKEMEFRLSSSNFHTVQDPVKMVTSIKNQETKYWREVREHRHQRWDASDDEIKWQIFLGINHQIYLVSKYKHSWVQRKRI